MMLVPAVLVVAVLGAVVLVALAVGVLVGRRAERRGGLLELDTPAGRRAVGVRLADPDDWFAEEGATRIERATRRFVGRCGHLVYDHCDYVVRVGDGTRWCSPRCEEEARARHHDPGPGFVPFAGGGSDAA